MPEPRPGLVVPGRELPGPEGWSRLFGRTAPLVIEVGFGKDSFLLEHAAAHPELDHVGVEWDPHRTERFLLAVAERGLGNVRAMPVSAELALGSCFAAGSARALHVYFPDPWPKERHAHQRLVRPWFAREALRILAPAGCLHLATDDDAYRAQIVEVMASGGFRLAPARAGVDASALHATKFERLWRGKERSIHHLLFEALCPIGESRVSE